MARKKTHPAQVMRRVANPTPAILLIANPNKEAVMPRAKRRATNPRRRTARPVYKKAATRKRANPVRYARTAATRRRAKKRNPLIIYRKRSNPSSAKGGDILEFAISGLMLGIVQPLLAPIVGRFIPSLATPISAAAAGYGLSLLADMFTVTRRFARPVKILGFSTAIIALAAPYVRRWLTPAAPVATASGMSGNRRLRSSGMNGVGVWATPSQSINAPAEPARPVQQPQGMSGVGAWAMPGRFARNR